jgi:hypothetical protein
LRLPFERRVGKDVPVKHSTDSILSQKETWRKVISTKGHNISLLLSGTFLNTIVRHQHIIQDESLANLMHSV